ncbi:hypothetical protein K458DRAFT_395888 [Lentithecium fluviatile CBS 122367]|uniref:Aminoglycoside phosphotransferase domain-containing protein n=1 Tax=Lentithecium fluviatile CBS 122367 TaxID=1168545 RepID=A0A6G1II45_9PLEO|nr:hypothetical protein K458DRAFT_395888 [Lentithecium fluviatile CBS 122367]
MPSEVVSRLVISHSQCRFSSIFTRKSSTEFVTSPSPTTEAPQLPQIDPLGHALDLDGPATTPNRVARNQIEDDEESDFEDEDGDSDKDKLDRREFKAIQSISREKAAECVLDLINPNEKPTNTAARTTRKVEGSFHNVAMVTTETIVPGRTEPTTQNVVLKIPLHGTPGQWRRKDGIELRREAILMKCIRHNCPGIPVPEIHCYDETLDNEMTVRETWLDADIPSDETEQKRITFLRSLAKALAQLNSLEFNMIGVPEFDNWQDKEPLTAGPAWRWHNKSCFKEPAWKGPFVSSKEFFRAGLDECWNPHRDLGEAPGQSGYYYCYGMRKAWK